MSVSVCQALTLTFSLSQLLALAFFTLGEHAHIRFELSVLLNRLKKLQGSMNMREAYSIEGLFKLGKDFFGKVGFRRELVHA